MDIYKNTVFLIIKIKIIYSFRCNIASDGLNLEWDAFKCSLRGREIQRSWQKAKQERREKRNLINFLTLQTDSSEYID